MKSIEMFRDYDYRPTRDVMRSYRAGRVYRRVPEAAVQKILESGAGRIVRDDERLG